MAFGTGFEIDADYFRGGGAKRADARGEPRRAQPHRFPGGERGMGHEEQCYPARRNEDEAPPRGFAGDAAGIETDPSGRKVTGCRWVMEGRRLETEQDGYAVESTRCCGP